MIYCWQQLPEGFSHPNIRQALVLRANEGRAEVVQTKAEAAWGSEKRDQCIMLAPYDSKSLPTVEGPLSEVVSSGMAGWNQLSDWWQATIDTLDAMGYEVTNLALDVEGPGSIHFSWIQDKPTAFAELWASPAVEKLPELLRNADPADLYIQRNQDLIDAWNVWGGRLLHDRLLDVFVRPAEEVWGKDVTSTNWDGVERLIPERKSGWLRHLGPLDTRRGRVASAPVCYGGDAQFRIDNAQGEVWPWWSPEQYTGGRGYLFNATAVNEPFTAEQIQAVASTLESQKKGPRA